MPQFLKGIYRNGQVILPSLPEGIEEAEVLVTFPDPPGLEIATLNLRSPSSPVAFGMFRSDRPIEVSDVEENQPSAEGF